MSTASPPPLWRNTSFTLMWSSVAASGFGDRMIQLAALALLGATAAGTQASSVQAGITFFFFLPYLVIGPVGGAIADRLPRKWVMLACDECRAGLLALAFLLVPGGGADAVPEAHRWKIYGLIAAVGTAAAVFGPTRNATVPQIVPGHQLQGANAIIIGIAVIASLIGFAVGGVLVERSVKAGLATAVGFFAVSGLFFAFLRPVPGRRDARPPQVTGLRALVAAGSLLARHRPLRNLIGLNALLWAASMLVLNASAALARHRLGLSPEEAISGFAFIAAALGAGMLTAAVAMTLVDNRREGATLIGLSLVATGACVLVLAEARSMGLALAAAFGTGLFGNLAIVTVITLLQSISPNRVRGRIFGVNAVATTIASVAINGVIWQLPGADGWMVPALWVTGACMILAGLGLTWRHLRSGPMDEAGINVLWRLTRFFCLAWHGARWDGTHHVPATGPVLLAPNHTTGIDPLLVQSTLARRVRWVMLSSYRFRILEPIWRRIDPVTLEPGTGNRGQIRAVVAALREGEAVGVFPEGQLQREQRRLQPLKPGVAMIAIRSGAPIVPVWISGTPRRRRMLWHFLQPSRSRVAFAKPIRVDGTDRDRVLEQLREAYVELAEAAGDGAAIA